MKVSTKQDWVFYVLNVIIILLKKVVEPSLNVLFAEEPYFQEIFTLQEKIMKLFAYIVLMTDQIRQQIQMRTKLIGLYT